MAVTYKLITKDTSIFANADGTLKDNKKYYVANTDVATHSKFQENPIIYTKYVTEYANIKSLTYNYNDGTVAYLDVSCKENNTSSVRTSNITLENADGHMSKYKLIIVLDASIILPIIVYGNITVTVTYTDNPYTSNNTSSHKPTVTVTLEITTDGVKSTKTLDSSEISSISFSCNNTTIVNFNTTTGELSFKAANDSTSTNKEVTVTCNVTSTLGNKTGTGTVKVVLQMKDSVTTYGYDNLKINTFSYPTISCDGETNVPPTITYSYDKITYVNDVETSRVSQTTGGTLSYTLTTNNNKSTSLSVASTTGSVSAGKLSDPLETTTLTIGIATATLTVNGKTTTKTTNINQEGYILTETYKNLTITLKYIPSILSSNITTEVTCTPELHYEYTKVISYKGTEVSTSTITDTGATEIKYSFTGSVFSSSNTSTGVLKYKNIENTETAEKLLTSVTVTVKIESLSNTNTPPYDIKQSGITSADTSVGYGIPVAIITYNNTVPVGGGSTGVPTISGSQTVTSYIHGTETGTITLTFNNLSGSEISDVSWVAQSVTGTVSNTGNVTFGSNAQNVSSRTCNVKLTFSRNGVKSGNITGTATLENDYIDISTYDYTSEALDITDTSALYSVAESYIGATAELTHFQLKYKILPKYTWASGAVSYETDTTKYILLTETNIYDTCIFLVYASPVVVVPSGKNLVWQRDNLSGTTTDTDVSIKIISKYGNKQAIIYTKAQLKTGTVTYGTVKVSNFTYEPNEFDEKGGTVEPTINCQLALTITHSDNTSINSIVSLPVTYSCPTTSIVNSTTGKVTLGPYLTGKSRTYTITATVTSKDNKTSTITTSVTLYGYTSVSKSFSKLNFSYSTAESVGGTVNPLVYWQAKRIITYYSGDTSVTYYDPLNTNGSSVILLSYEIKSDEDSSNLIDTSIINRTLPNINANTGALTWGENISITATSNPYVTVLLSISVTLPGAGDIGGTVSSTSTTKAQLYNGERFWSSGNSIYIWYNYTAYVLPSFTEKPGDTSIFIAHETGGTFRARIDATLSYGIKHSNNSSIHYSVDKEYIYNDNWGTSNYCPVTFTVLNSTPDNFIATIDACTGTVTIPDNSDSTVMNRLRYQISVLLQGHMGGVDGDIVVTASSNTAVYQDIVKSISYGDISVCSISYNTAPAEAPSGLEGSNAPLGYRMRPTVNIELGLNRTYASGRIKQSIAGRDTSDGGNIPDERWQLISPICPYILDGNIDSDGVFLWLGPNTAIEPRPQEVGLLFRRAGKLAVATTIATQAGRLPLVYANLRNVLASFTYNGKTNIVNQGARAYPVELVCTYQIDLMQGGTLISTITGTLDTFDEHGITTTWTSSNQSICPVYSTGLIRPSANRDTIAREFTITLTITLDSSITTVTTTIKLKCLYTFTYSDMSFSYINYPAFISCEGGTYTATFSYSFVQHTNDGITITDSIYSNNGAQFYIANLSSISTRVSNIDSDTGAITIKQNPTDLTGMFTVEIGIKYPDGTLSDLIKSILFNLQGHTSITKILNLAITEFSYDPNPLSNLGSSEVIPTVKYTYTLQIEYICGKTDTMTIPNCTGTITDGNPAPSGLTITYSDTGGYISTANGNTNTGIIEVDPYPNNRSVTMVYVTISSNDSSASANEAITLTGRNIVKTEYTSYSGSISYTYNNTVKAPLAGTDTSINVIPDITYTKKVTYNDGTFTITPRQYKNFAEDGLVPSYAIEPPISGCEIDSTTGKLFINENISPANRYIYVEMQLNYPKSFTNITYDDSFFNTTLLTTITLEGNSIVNYTYSNLTNLSFTYKYSNNFPASGGTYQITSIAFSYDMTAIYKNGDTKTVTVNRTSTATTPVNLTPVLTFQKFGTFITLNNVNTGEITIAENKSASTRTGNIRMLVKLINSTSTTILSETSDLQGIKQLPGPGVLTYDSPVVSATYPNVGENGGTVSPTVTITLNWYKDNILLSPAKTYTLLSSEVSYTWEKPNPAEAGTVDLTNGNVTYTANNLYQERVTNVKLTVTVNGQTGVAQPPCKLNPKTEILITGYRYSNLTITTLDYGTETQIPAAGGTYNLKSLNYSYNKTTLYSDNTESTASTRYRSNISSDGITEKVTYKCTVNGVTRNDVTFDSNGNVTFPANTTEGTINYLITCTVELTTASGKLTAPKNTGFGLDKPIPKTYRPVFMIWVNEDSTYKATFVTKS